MKTLVIIPCGKAKIWDRYPSLGPVFARSAYVGGPFRVNKEYALTFGDAYLILSAKYGLMLPSFQIPETYQVSFKLPETNPISLKSLRMQADVFREEYGQIIGLGGKEYRERIEAAFAPKEVYFPFAGIPNLGIGKAMKAIKDAVRKQKQKSNPSPYRGFQ